MLRCSALFAAIGCVVVGVCNPLPALADLESSTSADDALVESLGGARGGAADPKSLAKLLFSLASALDSGRTSTGQLQEVVSDRDPGASTSRTTLANSFGHYEDALSRLLVEASGLIDRPASAAMLYRTLTAGYRTCWQLDNYLRLVQSHGASGGALVTVVPTIEACRRFRRVAQQPRVEALILEALSSFDRADSRDDELQVLREELRAMEELLEDLRRIDEGKAELPR